MDQQKTGALLRALRREKGVTQEQLAERLCVSNRTVSRWENGNNLPDFAVLIELAAYYNVTVDEILRGERAAAPQPPQAQDALYRIAAYTQGEREAFARRLHGLLTAGAACGVLYGALLALGLAEDGPFAPVASFALGLACGALLVCALLTGRHAAGLRRVKLRLMRREA